MILGAALSAALGTTSMTDSGYPPARYQGDAAADATTFLTSQDAINLLCGKAPAGYHTLACVKDDVHLVLPNACKPEFAGQSYARITCHEMGHLNGWPSDHPRP